MEKFRSRLGSVLRVAKSSEQRAERVHHDAARQTTLATTDLQRVRDELRQLNQTTAAASVIDFQRERERLALRAEGVAISEAKLAELIEEQIIARAELLSAIRRRRRIEEFDARQRATHAMLVARANQNVLDDLASLRRRGSGR
jgi:hypothetical protein